MSPRNVLWVAVVMLGVAIPLHSVQIYVAAMLLAIMGAIASFMFWILGATRR